MQVLVERIGRGLYPVDGLAEEDVYRLPDHVELRADVVQPRQRSLPQLRLYWAILQLVADQMSDDGRNRPVDKDALHQWVKLRCGLIDDVVLRSGEIIEVPRSVALEKMEEAEFNSFFDRAMSAICAGLSKLGRDDLVAEAEAMLDRGAPQ